MSPPHDLLPADVMVDRSTCDREPIHTPGCIQPHGALMVADAQNMRISCVSANLPAALLDQPLVEVLGPDTAERLEAALRETGHSFSRVFTGALPTPDQLPRDLVAHRLGEQIFIEFEPPADAGEEAELLAKAQNIIQALRRTRNRQELCDLAVRELKRLTGFDRECATALMEKTTARSSPKRVSRHSRRFWACVTRQATSRGRRGICICNNGCARS